MATLMKQPNVRRVPAKKREAAAEHKKQNSRVLLAVAALLTGLSIAVPAAVMVFVVPLVRAQFHFNAEGHYWEGEVWWSYVFTGMALSIGFGLAGIVLAARSEVTAYRTDERKNGKTAPSGATTARVAISLAILDLILGPAAFVLLGGDAGTAVTIAFGLTGFVLAVRSKTGVYRGAEGQDVRTSRGWSTRAQMALALAVLVLILGPVVLRGLAVLTGIPLSIGFGVAGIMLALRSETGSYRAAEGQDVRSPRLQVTPMRLALWFAVLVLILGPVAFLITSMVWPEGNVVQWVELGLLGAGLVGIVGAIRPVARAASLVLPFAVAAFMMGVWASIPIQGGNDNLGRILIGAGLVGLAVEAWGVSASDPSVTRRWLLPFGIVAFVLALLGNAHMFVAFMPPILP